jgi:2,4-dienoyl-CoA reductase (NADPH2)
MASSPSSIAGYCAIAEAVHAEGARVGGQLSHYGNQAASAATREPLVGPSALPDVAVREPALPLDRAGMDRIIENFVAGAQSLAVAGFDAIEVKVAHDGLLRQFLSPLTNDRSDEYGGSIENRMRYVLEVVRAVRAAIGDDIALGIRLVLDECLPGGYDLDDGLAFAQAFEASGDVDYISSDVGIWASVHMVTAPMALPEGYAEEAFSRASAATSLPVIAFGRISRPDYAERLLSEGKAAAIGMARQLIADPEYANKALGGRPETIRPCTACNQLCVGNAMKLLPVSCTVNPWVGFGEDEPGGAQGEVGRVIVAGGGPAGMEAARVAAERGRTVTLLERSDRLGGRLALAAETGGRDGWRSYLDWLEAELARLAVDVRLGVEATRDGLDEAELVIVACGSHPGVPALAGEEVIELDDYLLSAPPAERVVLADLGAAGPPLWFAALDAARRGAEVTIVTPTPVVAGDLDGATFLALYGELSQLGVRFMTDRIVSGVDDGRVAVTNVYSGDSAALDADLVVVSARRVAAGEEFTEGLPAGTDVVVVGDALVPRDAAAAIREGQKAGARSLASRAGEGEAHSWAASMQPNGRSRSRV